MLVSDLELEILDDGVGEEFLAGFGDGLAGAFLVAAAQFNLEVFAHVHCLDAFITHVLEGVLDGLALGVEHGFFGSDNNLRFHRSSGANLG